MNLRKKYSKKATLNGHFWSKTKLKYRKHQHLLIFEQIYEKCFARKSIFFQIRQQSSAHIERNFIIKNAAENSFQFISSLISNIIFLIQNKETFDKGTMNSKMIKGRIGE